MRPVVYVIMPVGSDPEHRIRRARIDAVADALHLDTFHPLDHRHFSRNFDRATIRHEVQRCAVALADLTLERPSCYYELGIVQGIGLPTKMIAEVGTTIHQAADRDTVVFYESFDDMEERLTGLLRPYAKLAVTRR